MLCPHSREHPCTMTSKLGNGPVCQRLRVLLSLPRVHLASVWTWTKDPTCAASCQIAGQPDMDSSIDCRASTPHPPPQIHPSTFSSELGMGVSVLLPYY